MTADLASHIVVVDGATGRVRRRIATREAPRAIERIGRSDAIVAHTTEGVVSLIDGDDRRVSKVLTGFQHPRYIAVHPRQEFAYVTDSAAGEVVVVDLRRKTVVRRLDVGGPARHVSIRPRDAAVDALGSRRRTSPCSTRPARPSEVLRRVTPPFLAHDVAIPRTTVRSG